MKKISQEYKEYLIRLQHYRKKQRDSRGGKSKRGKNRKRWQLSGHTIIPVPPNLTLYTGSGFEESMRFIYEVRESVQNNRRVLLDFKETKQATAAATLRLHAEISAWQRCHKRNLVGNIHIDSGQVARILKNSGFLIELDDPSVEDGLLPGWLAIRTGTDAQGHLLSITSVCQKTPTPARNLRRTATLSARFRPRHRPHRHH